MLQAHLVFDNLHLKSSKKTECFRGETMEKIDFKESYRVFGDGIIQLMAATFLAVAYLLEARP